MVRPAERSFAAAQRKHPACGRRCKWQRRVLHLAASKRGAKWKSLVDGHSLKLTVRPWKLEDVMSFWDGPVSRGYVSFREGVWLKISILICAWYLLVIRFSIHNMTKWHDAMLWCSIQGPSFKVFKRSSNLIPLDQTRLPCCDGVRPSIISGVLLPRARWCWWRWC